MTLVCSTRRLGVGLLLALALPFSPVSAGPIENAGVAIERQDYAAAQRLLEPLAVSGNAEAQYTLGLMFRKGQGTEQNYPEAMRWYRKAAEQGHARAQTGLGAGYRKGHGVPQDVGEAFKWTMSGAMQGNANAQRGLGQMFANGEGVPPDKIQALMWLTLAAESAKGTRLEGGGSPAAERDALAATMPLEHVTKAQKLAQEWKVSGGSPMARNDSATNP